MTTISTDQHVFIAGKTGSGKSVLAEIYLAGYEHVVKLDTKGEYYERKKKGKKIWWGLEEGRDVTMIEHLSQIDSVETKKIIYCPATEEQTMEHYDALMKWIYQRENTILWIDELMEVAPSPHKYPFHLKALYTRGRSKNASVWALTQRPMDIPAIAMSQSDHFFIFQLNLPQDRKKMVDATGVLEFDELPDKYEFWYFYMGNDNARLARLNL